MKNAYPIVCESVGDILVIRIIERHVDLSSFNIVKYYLTKVINEYSRIVIDLSSVELMDSSGLQTLISWQMLMVRAGNELKLCGLSNDLMAYFEKKRIHHVFEIINSREAAIKSFSNSRPLPPLSQLTDNQTSNQ